MQPNKGLTPCLYGHIQKTKIEPTVLENDEAMHHNPLVIDKHVVYDPVKF